MNVTRHISIDDEHFEKMKPYLEKHNGNFQTALKEMIKEAGRYSPCMNSSAIDMSLFKWMINENDDVLVPDDVLDEFIDPALINSIGKLEEYLNRRFAELEWDITLLLKYDNDVFPSNILIEIRGSPQRIKFVASVLSQYLVKNSIEHAPLEIKSVINFDDCMKVELCRSNKKDSLISLANFFGGMDKIIKTLKNRPIFWKTIISDHLLSNYNMVTLHRNYFEDLLANKIPAGEIMIENLTKKPIQEIPLAELLFLIKDVYETSRVVERVEIDKDSMILFHNYRNKEAVDKLKKILVALLESGGHLYDAKSTANMVMLTHRPDIDKKINQIVENLKMSNNRIDRELVMFMAFLKGLKDIPDMPISLTALGRKIGKSLMQQYEKENGIKNWDLETFQNAFGMIDSKLQRVSEWRLDGKNLLYTIRRCGIASDGNKFDKYICHTARETFKGALDYAIGNRAELDIRKLVTNGDNFCEVLIRIP